MDHNALARRWIAAFLALMLVLPAAAQTGGAAGQTGIDRGNRGSPLPDGGSTRDLTAPGNGGVAGTGLGGSTGGTDTGAAEVPGTGMSVKGPAGQGIDGQGRTIGGIGAGAGSTGPDPGSGAGSGAGRIGN